MFEFRPPAVVQADADLTESLRRGDEAAVRELYGRYGGLVHAIALAATSDPQASSAELVTVHTFLQAWRNAEVFEPGRNFAPWLATLACSVASAVGPRPEASAVDALLADPSGWVAPPASLEDRVVAAVLSEAHVDPSEIYTAADLAAARSASSQRSTTVRSVVLGVVIGLGFLLIGIVVLSAFGDSPDTETTTIELVPTGRVLDAAGTIEIGQVGTGLSITLRTSSLPEFGDGGRYDARVLLDDGNVVAAGSFLGGEDDVNVELSAAVPAGQGDQFVVVGVTADAEPTPGAIDDADVILRAALP